MKKIPSTKKTDFLVKIPSKFGRSGYVKVKDIKQKKELNSRILKLRNFAEQLRERAAQTNQKNKEKALLSQH